MASKEQCDLLLADRSTLSVRKALALMWERRNEKNVIAEIIDIICKFVDEKKVFSEIEFYLPQFAHWIVHMYEESSDALDDLSKFALILSQISTHTALQLTFMLIAYLEDYQPENSDGLVNPYRNAVLFSRCAKLLQDVERAVICGGLDHENIITVDPLHSAVSSSNESDLKELRKAEIAGSLAQSKDDDFEGISNGFLLYKRSVRKSVLRSKAWKKRYFYVTLRTIRCYRDPYDAAPIRALQLQHCKVVVTDNHPKYGNTCFTVVSDMEGGTSYLLRAETAEERTKWVNVLNREIEGVPPAVFPTTVSVNPAAGPSSSLLYHEHRARDKAKLTPSQRIRYYHFIQEQIFVKNITNICDRLRFKDRPVRKLFLRRDLAVLEIPPLTYIPLGKSTDSVVVIRRCIPSEGVAFNTKARCPALILFELEEHPAQTDLATFLEAELDKYNEEEIVRPDICIVNSAPGTAEVSGTPGEEGEGASLRTEETRRPSAFQAHPHSQIWKAEGSGLGRLAEAPPVHLSLITMSFSGRFPPPISNTQAESESPMADSPVADSAHDISSNDKSYFSESFEQKTLSLKRKSDFGHLAGWKLGGLIAKSNDDLRQEVFVMQLLMIYEESFRDAKLNVWLHTYKILSTSKTTGLIELIKNATSLDGLKKSDRYPGSLRAYFEQAFGGAESAAFKAAMENYISSMAAYAVVTYLLGIKDRHNGNIMIDKDGHIIHIDFGFIFGLAPGKQFSMEKAPFKLNKEMVDVFGGVSSPYYEDFKSRVIKAFKVARMQGNFVSMLLELMTHKSNFPAFKYNAHAVRDFRARLFLSKPESSIDQRVEKLIQLSYNHRGSDLYDSFQLATNGIAK